MGSKIDDELTYRIIGCAMTVHKKLGCGFPEKIYQRALAIELKKQGLNFVQEMAIQLMYDQISIGTRRVDFFVEQKVIVELKAIHELKDGHLNQAINYCEATGLPYGLLLNFGSASLEYKRVYNINHPDNKPS